jgi:hypothetical protein
VGRLATRLLDALDPARLMRRCGWVPDPWQVEVLRSLADRLLLLCSRQAGKSTVVAVASLHQALYYAGSLVLLVSPTLRQSQEVFRIVMQGFARAGIPIAVTAESALRVEFENKSRIISLPGEEENIRGYANVSLLILDEASRVSDDLYRSVRPMLATSRGRLIALSTPYGRRGWFHAAWSGEAGWTRVRIEATQCPRIDPEFLADERRTLGDVWYGQEYLCQFAELENQLLSDAVIAEAFDPTVQPLWPGGRRPGGGFRHALYGRR